MSKNDCDYEASGDPGLDGKRSFEQPVRKKYQIKLSRNQKQNIKKANAELDNFKKKNDFKSDAQVGKILFPERKTTSLNNQISAIRQNKITKTNVEFAETLYQKIKSYESNQKTELNDDQIYRFLSKKLNTNFSDHEIYDLLGGYLLIRYSIVEPNKFIVSYFEFFKENKTLKFWCVRNNNSSIHHIHPVNIKTEGIVLTHNIQSIYCIGFSEDLSDKTMPIIENFIFLKNEPESIKPIFGYSLGVSFSKSREPYFSKVALIKIRNDEYCKILIKDAKNEIHNGGIIGVRSEEELLGNTVIKDIITSCGRGYTFNHNIKNNLSMVLDDEKILFLKKLMEPSNDQ